MSSQAYKQVLVLTASTVSFTVCFMIWMMFAVIGIPIKATLNLNETQFGILVAMPVLTGSLIRLPLGMLTDKFGGRPVFLILMLSTVIPIYGISLGTQYWQLWCSSNKISSPRHRRRLRLADGAQGLCGADAGNRHPVLAVYLFRPRAQGRQAR